MKCLRERCTPRKSVFDRSRRDVVLDLTDLVEHKINADEFFAENFLTEGMKVLLREGFRRLAGDSEQGVFVLTQAMGGGSAVRSGRAGPGDRQSSRSDRADRGQSSSWSWTGWPTICFASAVWPSRSFSGPCETT